MKAGVIILVGLENLIPVFFGWILGVGSPGIPKFYKWNKEKRIKWRYLPLVTQIEDTGITDDTFLLLPSVVNNEEDENIFKYTSNDLNEKDKKYLDKLEECVLYDRDWETFERIMK